MNGFYSVGMRIENGFKNEAEIQELLYKGQRASEIKMRKECYRLYQTLIERSTKLKIEKMIENLKEKPDSGILIPKSEWPKVPMYEGINNLWKYDIDIQMRATYTILKEKW